MVIVKYKREDVAQDVLKNMECENCRCKIDTEDVYAFNFATNKNNGKSLLLCGKCARELNNKLSIQID